MRRRRDASGVCGYVPVDFTAREGSVEKESDLNVLLSFADSFAEKTWQDHEMVILNPD
jgi:hypothetical protein